MKITQVIGTLRREGAERVTLILHKAFKKLGVNSKIVVLSSIQDYEIDDENILYGIEKLKDLKSDIVIAHLEDVSSAVENLDLKNVLNIIHSTYVLRFKEKNFFQN